MKPENLLYVTRELESEIVLADFGIAKTLDSKEESLQTMAGSFGYAAPEVMDRKGHGKPVDMWSMGVITYTLLCGYSPFRSENLRDLLEECSSGSVVFHERYWKDVSGDAKDFILKLIVPEPEQRWSSEVRLKLQTYPPQPEQIANKIPSNSKLLNTSGSVARTPPTTTCFPSFAAPARLVQSSSTLSWPSALRRGLLRSRPRSRIQTAQRWARLRKQYPGPCPPAPAPAPALGRGSQTSSATESRTVRCSARLFWALSETRRQRRPQLQRRRSCSRKRRSAPVRADVLGRNILDFSFDVFIPRTSLVYPVSIFCPFYFFFCGTLPLVSSFAQMRKMRRFLLRKTLMSVIWIEGGEEKQYQELGLYQEAEQALSWLL